MLTTLLARVRALWRTVARHPHHDADMDDEMRFHVEMQAERLQRERHLDPHEARRQALIAFGGVEKWQVEGRDAHGTQWIDAAAMDARLGLRMLIKHRALTIIGAFSMAVAIAIGAVAFELISEALRARLPFENGDRVVSIEYATDRPSVPEKAGIHELFEWRERADAIQHWGAFRTVSHNLSADGNYPEPVRVAEISASAFAIARTPPHLGRYLIADDERDGSAPVLVIGYQEWQRRFGSDPAIVGKRVTLDTIPFAIAGVMPQGFAFPVNHQYWIPLQHNPARYARGHAPGLTLFGVLAPGATIASAEAQLNAMHQRLATELPDVYGRLRPIVLPYTLEVVDIDRPQFVWGLRVIQLLISGLLIVVAVNLAILFYARAVTRVGEIAVRSAIGASRVRILVQLFIEALVLSLLSAAIGLVLAEAGLDWLRVTVRTIDSVPFWIPFELSSSTIMYGLVLAAVAAFIVGVIPGLKTTGARLDVNLRALGGGTGLRLGATWTVLIVAQVAIAAAVLPVAIYLVTEVVRMELADPGAAVESIVIAKIDGKRHAEITRRIESEPGVAAVTFSSFVPGFAGDRAIDFEDAQVRARLGIEYVNVMGVALNMFDAYDARIVAGRAFATSDLGTPAVIVNRAFAVKMFDTGTVLGQHFSFVREGTMTRTGVPLEVIGIVEDFPDLPQSPGAHGTPTVYQVMRPESLDVAIMSIRFRNVPADVIGRLRQIGAEVDASTPLRDVTTLSDFYARNRSLWRILSWALSLITISVLLLSAAGIYALMSFTVTQRTREIGIRTALGGDTRRILAGIFGRVMRQLAIGLFVGALLSAPIFTSIEMSPGHALQLIAIVASIILVVGVVAAIGPARRSLRLPAMEALRTE
jgi:putative ABC transport system permease protein